MTNERIAATAAAGQLAFVVFLLVPRAAELGFGLSALLVVLSSILTGWFATIATHHFGVEDPWHELGLDPAWDTALDDLSA